MTVVLNPVEHASLEAANGRFFYNPESQEITPPSPQVMSYTPEYLEALRLNSNDAKAALDTMTEEERYGYKKSLSAVVGRRAKEEDVLTVARVQQLMETAGRYDDAMCIVRRTGDFAVREFSK